MKNETEISKIDYASISEFIESNIQNKTRIAFLFDDKKTRKKDIKIYLGEILKTAKWEGYNQALQEVYPKKVEWMEIGFQGIIFKIPREYNHQLVEGCTRILNQARHDLLLEVEKISDNFITNGEKCIDGTIVWTMSEVEEFKNKLGELKDDTN